MRCRSFQMMFSPLIAVALASCTATPPDFQPDESPTPTVEPSTPDQTTSEPGSPTPVESPEPSATPVPATPVPATPVPDSPAPDSPAPDSPTPLEPTPSASPTPLEPTPDATADPTTAPSPAPPKPPDVPTPTPEPSPAPNLGALDLGSLSARNLVVIHTDALRADHLPGYGYGRNTLPTISGYNWLVVNGLYAASSWTAPSSSSLFSGLDLEHHNVRYYVVTPNGDGTANQALTAPTFVNHLHEQGYATGVFSGNEFVSPESGFGTGVDMFLDRGKDPGISNLEQLSTSALGWLDSLTPGRPFMMLFQPMDIHAPYSPSSQDLGVWSDPSNLPVDLTADDQTQSAELSLAYQTADQQGKDEITYQMRALYDEQILGLDRSVAALLHALETRGLLEDTLVVLTADHGETLNDENDGTFNHGRTVREELVHVPLMILAPGVPTGRQSCLARNMDTFPTLISALGLPPLENTEGQDLTQGCRDHTLSSNYWLDGSLYYVTAEDGREKLTWDCINSVEQSYDLETDPGAVTSLGAWGLNGRDTQLRAALTGFVTEIQASISGMVCPIATTNQQPTPPQGPGHPAASTRP